MKSFKTILVTVAFTLCYQATAEVPKVSNIRASQRADTKLVDILYDVEDAENDKLTIRIEISSDGGNRYNVPARTFEGAVGGNIDPGKNKKITWNAGLDWDGEFSDKMRVRITASDGKGLPGLEWSKEIPPGGFLMGQDGGPEGSGPSQHINLEYSFWISKFEITNKQYAEFLNLAFAAGLINNKAKKFNNVQLTIVGQTFPIRWNINKFEAHKEANYPARVYVLGAREFAQFYKYDVPRDFEWEKAARGPDHDDAGEHQKYTWGNGMAVDRRGTGIDSISGYRPIGSFDGVKDTFNDANGFGIHDLLGNAEWVADNNRTFNYPSVINLSLAKTNKDNFNPISGYNYKRGISIHSYTSLGMIYEKRSGGNSQDALAYFRIVRRSE